jgi:hypothetical protein
MDVYGKNKGSFRFGVGTVIANVVLCKLYSGGYFSKCKLLQGHFPGLWKCSCHVIVLTRAVSADIDGSPAQHLL